jgi:hypothetical protein
MREPDQIDMMSDYEVRSALRDVVTQNIELQHSLSTAERDRGQLQCCLARAELKISDLTFKNIEVEREIAELRSIVDAAKAYVKAACIGKVDGYNEWWALKSAVETQPTTEEASHEPNRE